MGAGAPPARVVDGAVSFPQLLFLETPPLPFVISTEANRISYFTMPATTTLAYQVL
jgi:hypothetical protein